MKGASLRGSRMPPVCLVCWAYPSGRRPRAQNTSEGSHLGMPLDLPGRAGDHGQEEGHRGYLSLQSLSPTTKLLKMDGWRDGATKQDPIKNHPSLRGSSSWGQECAQQIWIFWISAVEKFEFENVKTVRVYIIPLFKDQSDIAAVHYGIIITYQLSTIGAKATEILRRTA